MTRAESLLAHLQEHGEIRATGVRDKRPLINAIAKLRKRGHKIRTVYDPVNARVAKYVLERKCAQ